MADSLTPEARSDQMRRVRSKDTRPEIALRRLVHGLGYRYRVHARGVPGSPDISIKRRRKAIFIHGCFWHRHDCPSGRRRPKSRTEFWNKKFAQNQERDAKILHTLSCLGWSCLVVWECELRNPECLAQRVLEFLDA